MVCLPHSKKIKFCNYKEVVNYIKTLKSGKATGHDKISSNILRNLPRKALVLIVKIINGIFITGHFLAVWKTAKVIPIHKKGKDGSKIGSYRPISLLPHINKLVEKIIKYRIVSFLNENNIIINGQFEFRCDHSTVNQLARLTNALT